VKERLSVLRNTAIVSVAGYIETSIGLLVSIAIARALSPEDFGHYAFAVWLCGFAVSVSNHGLTTTSIKFLAELRGAGRRDTALHLAHRLMLYQRVSLLFVLAAFLLFAFVNPPEDWKQNLLGMTALGVIAIWGRAGYWMIGAIGKGFDRFEPENLAVVIAAVVNVSLVSVWAVIDGPAIGYFAIFSLWSLIVNLTARLTLRRCEVVPVAGPVPAETNLRFQRHLALTALLVALSVVSNRTIETALLKAFSSPADLGFFVIAGALSKGAVDFLAGGLSSTLLPVMSRAYGAGGSNLGRMLSEAIRLYWAIGLAVAGLGVVAGPGMILLLYGPEYAPAIPAVVASLVLAGLSLVGAAVVAYQTTSDLQADRVRVTIFTLIANCVAAVALIPKFGLMGAIGALAVGRVTNLLLSFVYLRRRTSVPLPWNRMLRTLTAAGIGVSVGIAVSGHSAAGTVSGALLFIGLFLVVSLPLRCWSRVDFQLASTLISRAGRRGEAVGRRLVLLGERYGSAQN
jgi:O-antigen/teichoic acid export membrane protein